MKTLILLFISSAAFAMPQHYTPWPYTGTKYLKDCPGECHPLVENGVMKDVEILDLKEVEEDDASKPIYQIEHTTICESEKACSDAMTPVCEETDPETEKCSRYRHYCEDYPGFSPIAEFPDNGKDGVVYCRKLLGYEKQIVRKLVEDPAKKAAKAARLAAEKAAADQAKADSLARRQRLRSPIDSASTVAQLRALMKDLIQELIKDN